MVKRLQRYLRMKPDPGKKKECWRLANKRKTWLSTSKGRNALEFCTYEHEERGDKIVLAPERHSPGLKKLIGEVQRRGMFNWSRLHDTWRKDLWRGGAGEEQGCMGSGLRPDGTGRWKVSVRESRIAGAGDRSSLAKGLRVIL